MGGVKPLNRDARVRDYVCDVERVCMYARGISMDVYASEYIQHDVDVEVER